MNDSRAMAKILLIGCVGLLVGVVWFSADVSGSDEAGIFEGGVWKGPLAFLAGVTAIVIAVRNLRRTP